MKRFTLFLILALMASMLPAACPPTGQAPDQALQIPVPFQVPGLPGLPDFFAEILWHVIVGAPISLDPIQGTTANDGGGWVPNPPLPPPPPHP